MLSRLLVGTVAVATYAASPDGQLAPQPKSAEVQATREVKPLGETPKEQPVDWIKFLAALGVGTVLGGLATEGFKALLARTASRREVARVVSVHVAPILRSCEELVSKINLLAKTDFAVFKPRDDEYEESLHDSVDRLSLFYCLGHFWAQLEILRRESAFARLAENARGYRLVKFIHFLESKGVKLLDRHLQRCLAEQMLRETSDGRLDCRSLVDFVAEMRESGPIARWFDALAPPATGRQDRRRWRDRIQTYGIVLIALAEQLDPKHSLTRPHNVHLNKLKRSSRHFLARAMPLNLEFVKNDERYHGLRKRKYPQR